MTHAVHDAVGLEMARRVAAGLEAHPEWMELAKGNLERWARRNSDSPGLVACYREWQGILARPVEEVIRVLLDPTDEGQRLRQNSPFAGVLAPEEVWEIKRKIRETMVD